MAPPDGYQADGTRDAPDTHDSAADAALTVLAPRVQLLRQLAGGGGLTAAAERAGVPQPTATRWLAEASTALGTDITVRAGRGIRLTRAGELLVDGARAAMAELRAAARAAAAEADPRTGTVTLGFLHTLGETRVPQLVSGFRRDYPGVRFHLTQTFHEALLDRLRDGAIDLALTAPMPGEPGETDHPDLAWNVLYEQPMRLVVPAAHRLAGAGRVRLHNLQSETFITLKHGYGLRHITDALLAEAGFVPGIAFEGEDVDTVRGLVGAGLGIAVLPAGDRSETAATVEVELSPPALRRIGLVWPAARPLAPAVAAFRDHAVASR
ncbi:LysR family transcriptional regulator [Tomitella cavernea]|uniref:LysR family transcriptional regulator n=1 Tax=Tomitella cavernea TaxID=1387982 RepID=UPI001907C80B|nr:LysR family transcriptional regulator [Tomitella cavernea]